MWESKADRSFAISKDTWNEPLGYGTEIKLHLREEAKEYLERYHRISIYFWFLQCNTFTEFFLQQKICYVHGGSCSLVDLLLMSVFSNSMIHEPVCGTRYTPKKVAAGTALQN
jgi:hypothetical protein